MKKLLATTAVIAALATGANAATLSISGGSAGSIPGGVAVNDLLGPLGLANPLGGFFASAIAAAGFGAKDKLLVEILGYEAGFKNTFADSVGSFTSAGGTVIGSFAAPLAKWTVGGIADGNLSFTFSTNGSISGSPIAPVSNGDPNANNPGEMNFFAHQMADGSILLFLDDGGASGDDDNHDDLVVRLSAVPLPAGALLLLTGVGALALRRRKTA